VDSVASLLAFVVAVGSVAVVSAAGTSAASPRLSDADIMNEIFFKRKKKNGGVKSIALPFGNGRIARREPPVGFFINTTRRRDGRTPERIKRECKKKKNCTARGKKNRIEISIEYINKNQQGTSLALRKKYR
jgi:hypothetical protein